MESIKESVIFLLQEVLVMRRSCISLPLSILSCICFSRSSEARLSGLHQNENSQGDRESFLAG